MGHIAGILIFFLNFLDGIFTMYFINIFDYRVEINPFMFWVMHQIGDWFLIPKLLFGFFIAFLMMKCWEKFKWVRIASMVIVFTYVAVVTYQGYALHELMFG